MNDVSAKLRTFAGLLATPLVPSHYLALLRPLAATHRPSARVEAIADETADTRTLTLRPGRGWRSHRAGQHVRVTVAIAGRLHTRTYSISSSPDRADGCFTITVKAQGLVSRALVHATAVGSYVAIGRPEGDFTLPDRLPAKLAFLTGGSGITPIASMVRTLAARGDVPDIVHVHHARHARDLIFGDELYDLAALHPSYRVWFVVDGERFSAARLAARVPDWRARPTWACGPQSLLDAITAAFTEAGCALQVERFTAARAPVPANENGGCVRFAGTRTERRGDARTPLLRIAEDAGVRAPSGCRMGICHTCDTTLLSGRVRDLRTGQTIDQPGARVQICVCAAAGDVELSL